MRTVLQHPTLASAFKDNRAKEIHKQATHQLEARLQPDRVAVAPDQRPPNGHRAATGSMKLAHIAGATVVRFGDHLQDICEDLASACSRPRGPTLTWSASEADLPINVATTFGLIADLLIANAYIHGFPPGRGGRIDASFTVDDEAWRLTIDDSGNTIQSLADRRCPGLTIARLLVLRHAGWLEMPGVIAGTRCIITIPRSMRACFHNAVPAASATAVQSWPDRPGLMIEAVA